MNSGQTRSRRNRNHSIRKQSPTHSNDSIPSPTKRNSQRQSGHMEMLNVLSKETQSPTHSTDSIPSPTKAALHTTDNPRSKQSSPIFRPLDLSKAAKGLHVSFDFDNKENNLSDNVSEMSAYAKEYNKKKLERENWSTKNTISGLEWFEKPQHTISKKVVFDLSLDKKENSHRTPDTKKIDFDRAIADAEQSFGEITCPTASFVHSDGSTRFLASDIKSHGEETLANADDDWFSIESRSIGSSETRETHFQEIVSKLQTEPEIVTLRAFEDEVHEKLRENIIGKWTRRFVQKRTKPKILNCLNKQRLEVLQNYVKRDKLVWTERETTYVNLSLRSRLHEEACGILIPIVDSHHSFDQYTRDRFESITQHINNLIQYRPPGFQLRHHIIFAIAIERLFGHRLLMHSFEFESFRKNTQSQPISLPDVAVVEVLQKNLSAALKRLERKLWQTHDRYKILDESIDTAVDGMIDHFAKFEQNPLVKNEVLNFPEAMLRLLRIIQSSNYQKRIISRIIPRMLPDFEQLEIRSTHIVLHLLSEWCQYIVSLNNFSMQEWEMLVSQKQKLAAHNSDEDTEATLFSLEGIKASYVEGTEFVQDEIPEVDRLSNAQVLMHSKNVVLVGVSNVTRQGAFEDIALDQQNIALNSSEVGTCSIVATRQGVIFCYRLENDHDPFLSVKITKLTNIHTHFSTAKFVLQDNTSSITIQLTGNDPKEFDMWNETLMSFSTLQ